MAEVLKKATKGMFQHKLANSQNIIEVQNGVYLNLQAQYQWFADDKLYLRVDWDPYVYNESQKKGVAYNTTLENGFNASVGVLTITGIGAQSGKALKGSYSTQISNLGNVKNVNISFSYENGNAIVDLTKDFNILKIPKPSKYDDNVVFNRAGLNEMIDYFKKYPVRLIKQSDEYGNIRIAHGIDPETNLPVYGLGHNDNGLAVTTNLLPNEDNEYNLGSPTDLRWKNLYISNNAEVGGTVTANTLEGLLKGTGIQIGGTESEPSFKVDQYGNVTMKGNITWGDSQFVTVYHEGDTNEIDNWKESYHYSDGTQYYAYNETTKNYDPVTINGSSPASREENFTNALNHYDGLYEKVTRTSKISPKKPTDGRSPTDFPSESKTDWHRTFNSKGEDWYMSLTFDGGQTWSEPYRINAQDGADGGWDARSILDALRDIDADGIYTLPSIKNGQVQGRLGIKASAIQSILSEFGIIEMGVLNKDADGFSKTNSWTSNNTELIGGYITFPIPAPFVLTPLSDIATEQQIDAINSRGWRARLGYLRGNGDGYNLTSGVGLAIYTTATYKDIYGKDIYSNGYAWTTNERTVPTVTATNAAQKCHLLLAFLMLTDAGLGLLTSVNKSKPLNWVFKDYLNASEDTTEGAGATDGDKDLPHYYYRWWSGAGESQLSQKDKYQRICRLWLHEDNGGLYWSGGNDTSGRTLKPWNWADGQITG